MMKEIIQVESKDMLITMSQDIKGKIVEKRFYKFTKNITEKTLNKSRRID